MKILVTGCRGFIGGSVGRFASAAGHEVLGVGRSSQPASDWPCGYVQADVALADLSAIVKDFAPEMVFHAAGTASVQASFGFPPDDLRAAVLTWANTLDSVRRSGLRPLILFPSSAAVYGNPSQLPVREDMPPAPISPYGFHKAICELLAREYATCFNLDIIVCRFFSIFGPAQRRLLVWELYKQFADAGRVVWMQGTGQESRDYLHIDEAAAAILRLAENHRGESGRGSSLFVNLASGEETKVISLAEQMRELVAPDKEIRCRGLERTGDPYRWYADVSLLQEMAAPWRPQPLSTSLAHCVAHWQKETGAVRHAN